MILDRQGHTIASLETSMSMISTQSDLPCSLVLIQVPIDNVMREIKYSASNLFWVAQGKPSRYCFCSLVYFTFGVTFLVKWQNVDPNERYIRNQYNKNND